MFRQLKKILEFSSKNGLYFPSAYDQKARGPSVSLFFAYISFIMTNVLIILYSVENLAQAVIMSMICTFMYLVFYLIRKLSKVKFDLDDKEIELDSGPEDTTKPVEEK